WVTSTRRRSGSTRHTGSASAVSATTRGWRSSPRWNACCRRRTRFCPRSNRCSPTTTRGYAHWPGCTSARCGSCLARAGGMRTRSRQAQLYWLLGDEESSAAALAEAKRCAERVTWPDALAELALSKAELARWNGDAEEAYRQLGVAITMLGDEAEQAGNRAATHDLLGYLADDLSEARTHRVSAFEAASEAGHAPLLAQVLVGIADLALRGDHYEQAARLLAASAAVRGLPDRSQPDVARIEQAARRHLGEARFAGATQ